MNRKRIFFFASFGDFKLPPSGGGQNAARRLLNTLKKLGYDVPLYSRHRPDDLTPIKNRLIFLLAFIVDPIVYFFKLLCHRHNTRASLYMCYCGSMMPFDLLAILDSKVLGYKTIIYLAGGGAKKLYEAGSKFYRFLFRIGMRLCDLVMLEGEENIGLIKEVSKTNTFYLPNYTEDGFAPSTLPEKPKDTWNIIYFGRICKEKNVDLTLDVFESLCKQYNNMHLTIVGSKDGEYAERIDNRISISKFKSKITRLTFLPHEQLKTILSDQHFYLFPSNEPREGHSNALNEAMSFGIVPVVSSNNFLPDIVKNPKLVSSDFDSNSYVNIISSIIDNGIYSSLSKEMFDRVQNNFTQSVVEKNLEDELTKAI